MSDAIEIFLVMFVVSAIFIIVIGIVDAIGTLVIPTITLATDSLPLGPCIALIFVLSLSVSEIVFN